MSSETTPPATTDASPPPAELPKAWAELLAALTLLARGLTDEISPFNCSHDQLAVMADPERFSPEELAQLDAWGFHVDSDGGFYSFRYGSA